jgi:hypothetical protein
MRLSGGDIPDAARTDRHDSKGADEGVRRHPSASLPIGVTHPLARFPVGDGRFEVLVVTDDDERYTMPASPGSMTALVALAKADTVMVWDPVNRSLIVAGIVGTMPWTVAAGS